MAKAFKLVTCTSSSSAVSSIDWTICFLCEHVTGEKLVYPLQHTGGVAGYKLLAKNVSIFNKLDQLSSTVKLDHLAKTTSQIS